MLWERWAVKQGPWQGGTFKGPEESAPDKDNISSISEATVIAECDMWRKMGTEE